MEITRILSSSNTKTKPTYLDALPSHIISLIYEYDGASYAKIIYQKYVLSSIKNVLRSEYYYRQAHVASCREYELNIELKHNKFLDSGPISTYMLGFNKVGNVCHCESPCCFKFQYQVETPYVCNCHQYKNNLPQRIIRPTSLGYTIQMRRQDVTVRVNELGFCVKIKKR